MKAQAEQVQKSIIAEIQAVITRKGITQAELSRRMGMQKQCISRMLTDCSSCPTISTLAKIADALGETLYVSFTSTKKGGENR
jgi:transcriptional regulator with XRE-family HTH domain